MNLFRFASWIKAKNFHFAFSRNEKTHNDPDQSRFTGAVWANQTGDLPARDFCVNVIEGRMPPLGKSFNQTANGYERLTFHKGDGWEAAAFRFLHLPLESVFGSPCFGGRYARIG